MSATVCKTAAPPHAILIWADERSIYAQLPSQNGPYVACFPRSEGGLSTALLIRAIVTHQTKEKRKWIAEEFSG